MWPPTTFRGRLALSMAGLSVVVLLGAGLLIHAQTWRVLRANLDQELLTLARTEAASGFDEPGVGVHVHELADAPSDEGVAPKLARVSDRAGRILATTAGLRDGVPLADDEGARARALAGQTAFADLRRGGVAYRAVYFPLSDPTGAPLSVLVALPTAPLDRALRAVLGALALSLLVGAAGAAWGAARLARHLTSPLERIAGAALTIRGSDPGQRIPPVSPDAELRALTDVLNEMLAGLEAAVRLERQAADAQRRFVADAAHELRSPLTNLRGTIEVTLRRPRTVGEYQETLLVAGKEIERLSRLANDLLTLSRFDAGQMPFQPRPCDLAAVARDAVAACASRADGRHVQVSLQAPAALPMVGDPDRLRQVLDNLLDNGLRHAPDGSTVAVTATLSAEARHPAVVLGVADVGPGLTAEQCARVFDRFYRADDSRARNSGGLGLGLTIAKAIVESHRGSLTVRSTPGAGCTFLATFPAAAA
jgi:two-component system, OmpR family, sensor kinase